MAQNKATKTKEEKTLPPDPALKVLEILIGRWKMTGRTLNAKKDNIESELSGEWILDGYFLKLEGWINFNGVMIKSVEIIGYDAEKKIYPSTVFSNSEGPPLPYQWDIKGNTLIHSGAGATYKGTIRDDGKTITGGWRPDQKDDSNSQSAYDATMYRVK